MCVFCGVLFCAPKVLSVSLLASWKVADLTREINRLRKRQQRQMQANRRLGLSALQLSVVVAVYVLSGYQAAPVKAFVLEKCRKGLHPADPEQMVALIEQSFLELSAEQVAAFHLPDTPAETKLRADALKFLAEWRAVDWVCRQNEQIGVAPASSAVASVYRQHCVETNVPNAPQEMERRIFNAEISHAGGRSLRAWALRFRKRWGLQFGFLQPQIRKDTPEVQQQAGFPDAKHRV